MPPHLLSLQELRRRDHPSILPSFHGGKESQREGREGGPHHTHSERECLVIRENLAKQDPSNAAWQSDLAYSYWFTGTTLARSDPKSQKEARSIIEKGRDILRQLKERAGLGAQEQRWLDSIEAYLRTMQENK